MRKKLRLHHLSPLPRHLSRHLFFNKINTLTTLSTFFSHYTERGSVVKGASWENLDIGGEGGEGGEARLKHRLADAPDAITLSGKALRIAAEHGGFERSSFPVRRYLVALADLHRVQHFGVVPARRSGRGWDVVVELWHDVLLGLKVVSMYGWPVVFK